MQTLKLTYFQARGRAETARLILAYGGLDYEDRRFPIGAKEFKPSAPYGQESLFICLWTSSDFLDSTEFFKGYRLKEPLKRQKKEEEKNWTNELPLHPLLTRRIKLTFPSVAHLRGGRSDHCPVHGHLQISGQGDRTCRDHQFGDGSGWRGCWCYQWCAECHCECQTIW